MRPLNSYILACLTVLTLFSCGKKETVATESATDSTAASTDEISFTEDQYKLADIQTGRPERRELSNLIKVTGVVDVEPQNVVTISAPLGGYVKSAGLLPGQAVRKGEVIAVLENPEFINLQQEYLESLGKFQFTEQEYRRQQQLREEDVNSSKTFQQVTSDYKILQARIAGLEEKLKLAGISMATLKEGKISPSARLYSPINGFVSSSHVNIGKYVNPTDVMFELTDKSDLHLALNVFEKDVNSLRVGQTVKFAMVNEDEVNHTAKIFLIGQASGDGRMFPVHCHFTEKNSKFLPGMYVKAWIETGTESQLTVPVQSIVQSAGQDVIVAQTAHNGNTYAFKLIPVRRGLEEGSYVAISFPADVNGDAVNLVVKGAYAVLSAIKNAGEEE